MGACFSCCNEDGTLCCCCCTCFAALHGVNANPDDVLKAKKRNLIFGIMYSVYGFIMLLCMVIPCLPGDASHLDGAMAGMAALSAGLGGLGTAIGLISLFAFLSGFLMAFWYMTFGAVFLLTHFVGDSWWAKQCCLPFACCNERISFCGCCHAFGGAGVGFVMALGSLICQLLLFISGVLLSGSIGYPMDGPSSALMVIMILCHLGAVITGCSVATSTLSYGQIMTFQWHGKAKQLEMTNTGEGDYPDDNRMA